MAEGLPAARLSFRFGVLLRLAATALAAAAAATALVDLPAWAAAAVCGTLGVVLALPSAADAAVHAGHRLTRYAPGSAAPRWLLGGPGLRAAQAVALGTGLALVLLVRLSAGGPGIWVVAALAAAVTAITLQACDAFARRVWTGTHAEVGLRWLAQAAGAVAALVGALLVGLAGALPDPAQVPGAASALVDEALALHRLWAGAEVWLMGRAVALSLMPAWVSVLLVVAGNAAVGWAVARLTVAALMDPAELRRGLAHASDAARAPPVSAAGLVAAGVVVAAAVMAAHRAEVELSARSPEARPVARLQIAADRVGAALYPPGTVEGLETLRTELARADAELADRMRAATDAGFDRVVANVDPFLDGYYSLWGEYARLIDWTRGQLQARLSAELSDALARDAPFAALDALRAEAAALNAAAQDAADGLRFARPLPPVNPGQVRLGAGIETLPVVPDLRVAGFATGIEARVGVSVAAGAVAGVVARRIIARLAARGALALAVRAIPLVGVAVGVATDAALVEIEEAMNRETFRSEIVAAIEAQRAVAHALLDGAAASP